MKVFVLIATLATCGAFLETSHFLDLVRLKSNPAASPVAAAPVPPASYNNYFKIVRAEYIALAGNWDTFDTTCFLMNTSVLNSLSLKEVYILGPGGVNSLLATYTGLLNVVVPPLGQVRLPINSSIPGVVVQTSQTAPGVRSVVVGWNGPPDALKLSAVIERNWPGNTEGKAFIDVVGHDLTF